MRLRNASGARMPLRCSREGELESPHAKLRVTAPKVAATPRPVVALRSDLRFITDARTRFLENEEYDGKKSWPGEAGRVRRSAATCSARRAGYRSDPGGP